MPESRDHTDTTLYATLGAIFAGLFIYSQTRAFVWDEGFHLLAARLIREGRRPYLDFCFPQTPLNAYINAAWMSIFGETWRSTHVLATMWLCGAIFLTVDFVDRRFPVAAWRLPAAVFTAVLIVSAYDIAAFGTVAQAYAICLFLTVASFRLAAAAVRRSNLALIAAAGFCAGASAACSMLTAAAIPVILAWCVLRSEGARWKTGASFVTAAVIPWAPVVWLFTQGPRQVFFNVIQYQALYRRVNWGEATPHDLQVFLGVSESPPALMLILLGAAGLAFVARKSGWDRSLRSEIYLSCAIAVAIAAELWTAHPTFERYFLLTVPFLAIPAAVGMFVVGSKLYRADRPWPSVALACALGVLGLATQFYEDRDSLKWRQMQQVADKVAEVTPAGASLYADEITYFLTHRAPPPGMEFSYGHKLNLPAAQEAMFHLLPEAKLDEMVARKTFATAESCDDDDMERLKLESLYAEQASVATCKVFWKLK